MEYLQNRFQYRTSIKGQLTRYHVTDLLTVPSQLSMMRVILRRVIFSLDDDVTRLLDNGVEYELRVWDDQVSYERNGSRQWPLSRMGMILILTTNTVTC